MLTAWCLAPLLLTVLSLGCGRLALAISGHQAGPAVAIPLGFAFLVVLGDFTKVSDLTAEAAAPLTAGAAVAGLVLGGKPRGRTVDPWGAAAALAVFVFYGAPVAFSGEPSFAGYIKLDDTATFLALTDRIADHGRDISGLPPSTYEATLDFHLGQGYPIGSIVPLSVLATLTSTDPAWLYQPYLAWLVALLAVCLYTLGTALIESRGLCALVAVLGSLSALLLGYSLWGGVKEVATVPLLAGAASAAPLALNGWRDFRAVFPLALFVAAVTSVLTPAGSVVWLAPMAVPLVWLSVNEYGGRRTVRTVMRLLGVAVVLSLTAVLSLGWLTNTSVLSNPSIGSNRDVALANLIEPLSSFQVFGIWPVGDFRLHPANPEATGVLIAVTVVLAIVGAAWALRRRSSPLLAYFCSGAVGCLILTVAGTPWLDAKAFATASPAVLFAAAAGAALLFQRGLRFVGGTGLALIAAGVLWSWALAYHEVLLAPHDTHSELERIGEQIAGQGPTLMTDYEPYGVRHFLRDGDPEGAAEYRRRTVALVGGSTLEKGEFADIDRFQLSGLLEYRTLVLRRSPLASRPPLPFQLTWRGSFFEVWQQPQEGGSAPLQHLGLGSDERVSTLPRCSEIMRLSRTPGAGQVVAAVRPAPRVVSLPNFSRPVGWVADTANGRQIYPAGSGTATAAISVDGPLDATFWLGGSWRGDVKIYIDGELIDSVGETLNHTLQFTPFGPFPLAGGEHRVEIRYEKRAMAPGSGGTPFAMGPLVISSKTAAEATLLSVPAGDAPQLCGRRLDWVETF